MITRRAAVAITLLAPFVRAEEKPASPLQLALQNSKLVYISPLRKDGTESTCHAEVWFVMFEGDLCIVTASNAWRVRSVKSEQGRARLWVGDHGLWYDEKSKFREAPTVDATGRIETDPVTHDTVLAKFSEKYPGGWSTWGPRFQRGLESGERTMVRYHLDSAPSPSEGD